MSPTLHVSLGRLIQKTTADRLSMNALVYR
jgi:hypothetical protein